MDSSLLLAFYGDDFTGSTDALEFLSRAGAKTALFIAPPTPAQLAQYPNLQALGIAGATRAMPPDAMEAELRPAFTALKSLNPRHVHYKVCSTFDSSPTIGSIGRAIDIGADIFQTKTVPLLVGAPPLGRYCVFGNLFARMGIGTAGEIHRLDRHPSMSRHPVTPADESDLRLHLAKQTNKKIALFDILQLALPEADSHAALHQLLAQNPDILLFDLLYPNQLERLGALIDSLATAQTPLFSTGSSAIEMTLGALWSAKNKLTPKHDWPNPGPASPLLVLSGSCSPITANQIDHVIKSGFAEVPLPTPEILAEAVGGQTASFDKTITEITTHLRANRSVILHSNLGPKDPRKTAITPLTAPAIGNALGQIARTALEQTKLRRLIVAGGDTSSFAARALGIEAVEMLAPLTPGAPLCRAHAPNSPAHNIEINFKGGQVGPENYFTLALEGKSLTP
ncbi:MAG: four-carbon acid sugar kinase family protein [Phycisphaerae bacterium]